MDFLIDIFKYQYLLNALIAAVLSGIVCGVVGTYIVSRRMVFLAGGITHASFGGIGISLYLGSNPILGALIFAMGSSLGIEWANQKGKIREDSAIGIIWSLGMAIGALFMSLRAGYTSGDLSSYLFGSILTVTSGDVVALGIVTAIVILGAIFFLHSVMLVAFDSDFAKSKGVATKKISYIMAIATAVAIVLSIRIMGIILLISLLSLPVVIADMVSKSYRSIVIIAPIIAVIGNLGGLIFSYYCEIPPGTAIIFILIFMLIAVKIVTLSRQKKLISR
ncbi:MAG: metal ABC transporter permease [Rikenellaceae bacterium]